MYVMYIELLMPGATVLQVSSQRSGTNTVDLKVLTKGGKSYSIDLV